MKKIEKNVVHALNIVRNVKMKQFVIYVKKIGLKHQILSIVMEIVVIVWQKMLT